MSPFVRLQHAIPQHFLSRAIGRLAASEVPWLSAPLVHLFAKAYAVNMAESERPGLRDYRSFNDFFTRSLAPGARPVDPDPSAVVSPADGVVSQSGVVERGELIQAKGVRYSLGGLADVCAGPEYEGGAFATVYLSPKDYHRVHLPVAGRLVRTVAIPGKLFSVNASTEGEVEGLFAINERLVCEFETAFGKMLVVLVGALIVASIETVWDGPRSPYKTKQVVEHDRAFETGDEIGRFLLGSSVVLAFERGGVTLDPSLVAGAEVRMGARIGEGA
ncbi:archaetidylserine decarboxylase [Rubrivirga sp. S365]|uniref:Phosphatidylserine decarboxylase proenzyme n=1 Tax=Rubrivirga litoralis TaxID=3075598 RepID=A0ABU3BQN7_9BACT|nr:MULTISPECIES: archaetidylserine decarboxylase [unclassified Rubrivirga]MDT0631602.1 archaetidylserine decarboxylase [Rubrivirga sp. F394]MDT7857247.1 archaetidylserine decarboxylase [Rubrivirga sp. S365]